MSKKWIPGIVLMVTGGMFVITLVTDIIIQLIHEGQSIIPFIVMFAFLGCFLLGGYLVTKSN